MKLKNIIIGQGAVLTRVSEPAPEDIVLISEEVYLKKLPQHLQTKEVVEIISYFGMEIACKMAHIRPMNLANIQIGPTDQDVRDFLCEKIALNFQPGLTGLIKKLEADYIYELILLTDRDFDKIAGIGTSKKHAIHQRLSARGLTTNLIKVIRPILRGQYEMLIVERGEESLAIHRHNEMVKLIQSLEF